MAKLTTIFWRDIPAQLIGQQGRTRHKQELSKRFAVAIDRAAMRAGKGSSKAYLEEWRREVQRVQGPLEDVVSAEAERLEADWSDERLEKVTRAGGRMRDEET